MKIDENLWLESAYYVDVDEHGQLRIAGPHNHLYFGSVGIKPDDYEIESVSSNRQGELVVKGKLYGRKVFWHDPAMGPMLRVRGLIEPPGKIKPTFAQIMHRRPDSILPHYIGSEETEHGYNITYRRFYEDTWYGVQMSFGKNTTIRRQQSHRGYWIQTASDGIEFKLMTETKSLPKPPLRQIFSDRPEPTVERDLMERLRNETEFLVRNNRTSGFDYGTVFPRDWMEAADLGAGDLSPSAIRHMYSQALSLVNPAGMGWHENITGELEAEKNLQRSELPTTIEELIDRESRLGRLMQDMVHKVQEMYIIRNMIDIEPHYLLGLQRLDPQTLNRHDQVRLKRAAKFLVTQADEFRLITFKKIPELFRRHRQEEYYGAGNWRDSERAFKMVHPVIAPYDVNAVFYPQALKVVAKHAKWFGIPPAKLRSLIERWSANRELYRFTNSDGIPAMALALYDVSDEADELSFRRFEVNHTDEAYELFYGDPLEKDLVSFCRRLLDKNYFYTPAGPTIVGAKDGYTTLDYHGRVSWTKQTAFVTGGLSRQLKNPAFKLDTRDLISETLKKTAEASLKAIEKLGATELHYCKNGQPRFYNDQALAEGPMNKVQLWSAVGARRIVHDYLALRSERAPARGHGSRRRGQRVK